MKIRVMAFSVLAFVFVGCGVKTAGSGAAGGGSDSPKVESLPIEVITAAELDKA
jgi:hypothetical protein